MSCKGSHEQNEFSIDSMKNMYNLAVANLFVESIIINWTIFRTKKVDYANFRIFMLNWMKKKNCNDILEQNKFD